MVVTGSQTVTILSGASLSGAIDLQGARLFAILMPSGWTAAGLTFQAGVSLSGTFYNLFDSDGSEVAVASAAAVADQYIQLTNPARWLGIRYLKVRSGTAGAAVNQGADRTISLIAVQ